ncbi:hypothetical protein PG990_014646 [Apiospora arundinis]
MWRSIEELKKCRPTEACHNCRRLKIKCDGSRPRCGHCANKRRGCGYKVDEENKQKTRLAILDAFVDNLQNLPETQASQLLRWWRDSDGTCESLSTLPDVIRETINVSPNNPWHQASQWLPSLELATYFVDAFFRSNDKLFHVFSKEQIHQCLEASYQFPNEDKPEYKANVCCLMAVAAIGAKSGHGVADLGPQYQQRLYDLARYHLEAVFQLRPSNAIQVYTLLCLYNVMNNANVAVTYIACSWLCISLGAVLEIDMMLPEAQLTDFGINASNDITETIQTELAKVAIVMTKIMKVLRAAEKLTPELLQASMEGLQSWYRKLPSEMQLKTLMHPTQSMRIRRSGCHVHLLHLGGIMMCYHRITQTTHNDAWKTQQISSLDQGMCSLGDFIDQAVKAAATSAKILRLLLTKKILLKNCWLSASLARTSCVVLLHYITQKRLAGVWGWDSELQDAAHCLNVLEFCGTADSAVAQAYKQLREIHLKLCSSIELRINQEGTTGDQVNCPVAEQCCTSSLGVDLCTEETSFVLIDMLGTSFGQITRDCIQY